MSKQLWKLEPTDRWVRATLNGETIIDCKRAKLMIESRGEQDYYFPWDDVRHDLLIESDYAETSGYRGQKCFWHLQFGETLVENAAWTYAIKDGRPDFTGYVAFAWNALDHWYEEEEEIYYHPRNPFHRVDTIESARHVAVLVNGVKVAETKRPYLVFETGIETRYYFPAEDVETQYLYLTNSETVCPYKGFANYFSLVVNSETYEDVVWTYLEPIPEAPKIKGLLAFWPEKDRRIEIVVDGEAV